MKLAHLRKVWRYTGLYGPARTYCKIAGRTRKLPVPIIGRHDPRDIALIGCGQFGVSTIGYFLTRKYGRRIKLVHDVDEFAAQSALRMLGAREAVSSPARILEDQDIRYVYIASNHASHTDYAVAALEAGKTVYVEKPVAVTRRQLARLLAAERKRPGRLFAGYNRPHSAAVRKLRELSGDNLQGALSLNCFVSGHVIGPDHWYRDPQEGTRICGNAGHWIDLFVHVLSWRGIPDNFRIQLLQGDPREPDDNFALSIATDRGDIFTLMLTARSEPFEGINETINFQQDDVICKIDDFRRMAVWKGASLFRKRFWPKDPGHRAAVFQPFRKNDERDWKEVAVSTVLMLRIVDMVRGLEPLAELDLSLELKELAGAM